MAESKGFEPLIRCRIPDFESGAFDHSANSPRTRDYTDIRAGPLAAPDCNGRATKTRGPQPPPRNARSSQAMTTTYYFAGAEAGAAAFAAGAGAPLAAGAAPLPGAAAAMTVGAICGVTTLPLAFCSAM